MAKFAYVYDGWSFSEAFIVDGDFTDSSVRDLLAERFPFCDKVAFMGGEWLYDFLTNMKLVYQPTHAFWLEPLTSLFIGALKAAYCCGVYAAISDCNPLGDLY